MRRQGSPSLRFPVPEKLNRNEPVIDPVLSARLAGRADRLVREILVSYKSLSPPGTLDIEDWKAKRDAEVLNLRVLVGMALHDAASYGLLDAYRRMQNKQPAIPPLPKQMPEGWEDEPTQPYRTQQRPHSTVEVDGKRK